MSQPPTPYEKGFSFSNWSITHPGEPHQGDKIDAEFIDVAASLQETIDRLNEIQRDDGMVRPEKVVGGVLEIAQLAAEEAAAAVYATNLAQLSDKALARANLQLPQHYSLLDGTNVAGWTTLPVNPLALYWPEVPFAPQGYQNLQSSGALYQTLGSYSSRAFRASVITGSLKDIATWTGVGDMPADVPTITTRIDDICAAIGAGGVPTTIWASYEGVLFMSLDYTDPQNLPNIANPFATMKNVQDAVATHVSDFVAAPNLSTNIFHVRMPTFNPETNELTFILAGMQYVVPVTSATPAP